MQDRVFLMVDHHIEHRLCGGKAFEKDKKKVEKRFSVEAQFSIAKDRLFNQKNTKLERHKKITVYEHL